MECTPSPCYSDVVRGVINSRGILSNIALYNDVRAEAHTI
jgi:chemotaxis signal transduction protein